MKIVQHAISITTLGRSTQDITPKINSIVGESNITTGICHVFLKHTSASLIMCENDDLQVRKDLENFLLRLIPDGDSLFKHVLEGEDDMPAHIRTILTQTELNIPIVQHALALGTWQGIFLYEHRYIEHERHLVITIMGE